MELGANAIENFTPERASDSLNYWRRIGDLVLSDPEARQSEAALGSYSHDAKASANLLAAHNFNHEAEEAYAVARKLWPRSPGVAAN